MTDHKPEDRACAADLAAYALGAMEADEAVAFERHLHTCPDCRRELARHRQVVADLAISDPLVPAPRGLRRRVFEQIEREQPAEPRRARSGHAIFGPRGARSGHAIFGSRRAFSNRHTTVTGSRGAIGLAGSVAAVLVALVVALSLPAGPSTRAISARVVGPGSATLELSGGHGELVLRHFAAPPAGKIYEVWVQRPHRAPAPTTALFSVTRDGRADVRVPVNLSGVRRVMVTPEPPGGSRTPTHAPVIIATIA